MNQIMCIVGLYGSLLCGLFPNLISLSILLIYTLMYTLFDMFYTTYNNSRG